MYYVASYTIVGKTLGESFFNAKIVANKGWMPVWIRILLRETFTSFPALIAWTLDKPHFPMDLPLCTPALCYYERNHNQQI